MQRSLSGRQHCGPHLRFARVVDEAPFVMRSVPHFLKGPFQNALRLALEEVVSEEFIHQERGWKLMQLLPRMLLHRPPWGGLIAKDKLHQRFQSFVRGEWLMLLGLGALSSKLQKNSSKKHFIQDTSSKNTFIPKWFIQ